MKYSKLNNRWKLEPCNSFLNLVNIKDISYGLLCFKIARLIFFMYTLHSGKSSFMICISDIFQQCLYYNYGLLTNGSLKVFFLVLLGSWTHTLRCLGRTSQPESGIYILKRDLNLGPSEPTVFEHCWRLSPLSHHSWIIARFNYFWKDQVKRERDSEGDWLKSHYWTDEWNDLRS